jgi:fatty acid-binding protein DegV
VVHAAVSQNHAPVRLAAVHALVPEEAEALLEAASPQLNVVEKVCTDFSPAIATHTGPGTLGLICTPA